MGSDTHEGDSEQDWSDHWPTDPELISGARDGFVVNLNNTQLFFKCRGGFPMLIEIYVEDEPEPIGSFNSAKAETVTLGGVSEGLADEVDKIRELPIGEIPEELERLAYRLNPSGRQDPETNDSKDTDSD